MTFKALSNSSLRFINYITSNKDISEIKSKGSASSLHRDYQSKTVHSSYKYNNNQSLLPLGGVGNTTCIKLLICTVLFIQIDCPNEGWLKNYE